MIAQDSRGAIQFLEQAYFPNLPVVEAEEIFSYVMDYRLKLYSVYISEITERLTANQKAILKKKERWCSSIIHIKRNIRI